jgi:hypothetical protein
MYQLLNLLFDKGHLREFSQMSRIEWRVRHTDNLNLISSNITIIIVFAKISGKVFKIFIGSFWVFNIMQVEHGTMRSKKYIIEFGGDII